MNRLSGTTALLAAAAAALIVLLVGWFALVSPQRSKADKLDTQIGAVQTQISDAEHVLSSANQRQTAVALRAGRRAVPDQAQVSEILRQLAGAAAKSNVELDTIGPQAAVADVGTQDLPIVLSVKGHYFAIQKFLRLLQQSADVKGGKIAGKGRLYSVGSITFANGGSQPGQPTSSVISASLSITAYINSPATTPAVPTPTTTDSSATAAGPTP
jgi:hypothetical protein